MKSVIRALLVTLGVLTVLAQQPRYDRSGNPIAVPLSEEPYHHMLFENELMRVWSVELPPQKNTLLHQHDFDFVYIVLTDGHVLSALDGRSLVIGHEESNGDVRFLHGRHSHQLRNDEGFTTYRNITVEVRKKSDQPYIYPLTEAIYYDYDALPLPADPSKSYALALDRDTVRITGVKIFPGDSQQVKTADGPILVVALGDLELKPAGEEKSVTMQKGDVLWQPAQFVKPLTNASRDPARFVVLELK